MKKKLKNIINRNAEEARKKFQEDRYQIDNHTLKQLESFRYIGSIINQDRKCTKNIKSRIAQAKEVYLQKKFIWFKNMSISLKKQLIKVHV